MNSKDIEKYKREIDKQLETESKKVLSELDEIIRKRGSFWNFLKFWEP